MIGLIFAQTSNGYIGKDGKLLFQIPADLKRFKELTEGCVVIMGRKTWESLPEKARPLPGRINVVLTSKESGSFPGAVIVPSLHGALLNAVQYAPNKDIWIIGGQSVYEEAMKYADVIHQTFVTKEFDGDAKAPYIDPDVWQAEVGKPFMEHEGLYYQFNTYKRIKS